MATSDSVNYSPAFKISTVGSDQFSIQDQINLVTDIDGHDHSSGKGLPAVRVKSGTHASRPATGNAGHVWVGTDTPLFSHDNANEWVGHVVPIESHTISIAVASQTLQGPSYGGGALPTNFRHLMAECYIRTTSVFFAENINVIFNADAGANYDSAYLDMGGPAPGYARVEVDTQTSGVVGEVPAVNATANRYGHITFKIPYYQATGHKVITYQSTDPWRTAGTNFSFRIGGVCWKSTAAITSMTLTPAGGGNFDVGSIFTLYGLP